MILLHQGQLFHNSLALYACRLDNSLVPVTTDYLVVVQKSFRGIVLPEQWLSRPSNSNNGRSAVAQGCPGLSGEEVAEW